MFDGPEAVDEGPPTLWWPQYKPPGPSALYGPTIPYTYIIDHGLIHHRPIGTFVKPHLNSLLILS